MTALSPTALPLLAVAAPTASTAQTLFLALNIAWGACEVYLSLRRRAAGGASRDGGTLGMLWRVLVLSIAAAVWLAASGQGHLPAAWVEPARWAGCVLIAGGLALRLWAVHVLARFFTVDVNLQRDHQLVQRGPYRWVRHPSYTGALMAFLGLGVGLANPFSLLLLFVPVAWAFGQRIRIEETALREAFPETYPAYAARTGRLLPSLSRFR